MALPLKKNLLPIEIPDAEWGLQRLAHKTELMLLRFALRVIETVRLPFIEVREKAIRFLFENTAEQLRPTIMPFFDRIEAMPNLPPEVRVAIQEMRGTEPITLTALGIFILMAAVGGIVSGMMSPFQRYAGQELDNLVKSARMPPPDAYIAHWRRDLTPEQLRDQLGDLGWSEELGDAWASIVKPRLSADDWGELFVRRAIDEFPFEEELRMRGFDSEQIAHIKTLLQVIPPIPDIIRMAVREAFTPEIVREFQLEAELPQEFVEWAEKKGLDPQWTRAYWASHWSLPSLTMGFEMLHRRIISPSEMELLIKAQDISPFWRDKLIDLSYSPYTRVDVRRMHASGILSEDDVYESYLDIGYDPEKARNMTNFTIAYNAGGERDLTKAEILYGRKEGFFSYEELGELLADLGYDQNEIDYYEARIHYDLWKGVVKETVAYVKKMYVAQQFDQNDAYQALGELNLPSDQMNRYIRQWDIDRKQKTERPTKADLLKFFVNDVIGIEDFTREMAGHGFSDKYITWYIQFIQKGLGL